MWPILRHQRKYYISFKAAALRCRLSGVGDLTAALQRDSFFPRADIIKSDHYGGEQTNSSSVCSTESVEEVRQVLSWGELYKNSLSTNSRESLISISSCLLQEFIDLTATKQIYQKYH